MRASLLGLVAALGCSGGELTLAIDVKTDFAPGVEFTAVEVDVRSENDPAARRDMSTRPAASGEAFYRGLRVRELTVVPGVYRVTVRLRDALRQVIASRPMLIRIDRSYSSMILITRDCRGVMCPLPGGDPALEACLGGRCVHPECGPMRPELCGGDCTDPTMDCAPGPACLVVRCEEGACFREPTPGACPPGQWCNPASGCEDVPEPPDAGPLPPDAGPMIDAGPPMCAMACDDGAYCNGLERCVGTMCVAGSNPCAPSEVCNEAADRCDPPTCGVCSPGAEELAGPCGLCGTSRRVCEPDCQWGAWGCSGGGVCPATTTETGGACGNCGTYQRDCSATCTWGGWQCRNEGSCSPGETRDVGDCTCSGWRVQEECQGDCNTWQNIGCRDVGGGLPCNGVCGGTTGYCWMGSTCDCSDGSWINCSPGC